jgi:2-C-methyl-D-erythritol 4-phosphate cytidylyltransferase
MEKFMKSDQNGRYLEITGTTIEKFGWTLYLFQENNLFEEIILYSSYSFENDFLIFVLCIFQPKSF